MDEKQAPANITRREALRLGAGVLASAAVGGASAAEADIWPNPYRDIRGFGYQPSYEATGYSIWRQFQPDKFDVELGNGKKYFPKFNAVRYWLSFDAFAVDPAGFAEHFETAVAIAHRHGLRVIPTLFNNWHSVPEFGGIADEKLRYWFGDYGKKGTAANYVFRPYLEKVVGEHAKDARILAWDLCNEPHNNCSWPLVLEWLTHTYGLCKTLGATQPVSVSVQSQVESVEAISDFFMIHPYFAQADKLGKIVAFARQKNKGVLATECCWGSLDDAKRAQMVASDCGTLAQAGIGFMPHALQESLVGDLHRPQYGVISSASSMHFVAMDGSLRPGHEVYNRF
jgi:hypothetical protein